MPTLGEMIETFIEDNAYGREYDFKDLNKFLISGDMLALSQKEKLKHTWEVNRIATSKNESISLYIAEAMEDSMENLKRFKDKAICKKIYNDLATYLNSSYSFCINLDQMNDKIIGTSEERCVYLLRQTERQLCGEEKKSLSDIADELGCSKRVLEKDIKKMTEQGFKLLGMNIELTKERGDLLNMSSTPHPIILMENISQIVVLLEGLRNMSRIKAYKTWANITSVDIWNQLTDYARIKVLDAIELFEEDKSAVNWYDQLNNETQYHGKFVAEMEMSEENLENQLMHIAKSDSLFDLSYIDEQNESFTLRECHMKNYFTNKDLLIIDHLEGQSQIKTSSVENIHIY